MPPPQLTKLRVKSDKRRKRHDLPGPAGSWFRREKLKKLAKRTASSNAADTNDVDNAESAANTATSGDGDLAQQHPRTPASSNNNNGCSNIRMMRGLHHDNSTTLNQSAPWNMMCNALERIVAPPEEFHLMDDAVTAYSRELRSSLPDNFAMLSEIHEGRYDNHTLGTPILRKNELRVPHIALYVQSVQCNACSDWTAYVVDELYGMAAVKGDTIRAGRSLKCWLQKAQVKEFLRYVNKISLREKKGADADRQNS